jgi:glycopeptide antibiotics resistance protein
LGIAPNFFPAIGIPALFVLFMMQLKTSNKWLNEKKDLTTNLISVTGLIAWEFIQTSSKKLHFDWNDIIWTMIGAAIFQLIWILTPERLK